jgi:DNA-binding XRE family transcriptional regulator
MKKSGIKIIREGLLLSKAELARKAGLSPLTIDRIEKGKNCRPETKRKVLVALGLKLTDREKFLVIN